MSIQQNFPAISPSLSLNFARSKTLDPRITFTRTSSGTRTNETGLVEVVPANSPRFDHSYDPVSGTVRSLGLLVEESRTNLIRYSIISNVVGWSISGSTVTNNATTAPDGTNTAARIQVDPGGYVADLSISVTAGQTYTFSFWVKSVSGSGTWGINIYDHGGANIGHHRTTVNITEEWQRVSYTYTPTGTLVNVYVSDNREGLATISDAYVWGLQIEKGSFKTSLIPTEGSTVTRTADNVSMVGENFSSWYNPSEGTVYADTNINGVRVPGFDRIWVFTNSNFNLDGLGFYSSNSSTSDGRYAISGEINGVSIYSPNNIITTISVFDTPRMKSCFGFVEGGNCNISFNGVLPNTNGVTATDFPNVDRFLIGQPQRFQGHSCMTISQLIYYPRRLTNSQLQALTK
jgi:hypothetical protein